MKRLFILLAFLALLSSTLGTCGISDSARITNDTQYVEPVPEPESQEQYVNHVPEPEGQEQYDNEYESTESSRNSDELDPEEEAPPSDNSHDDDMTPITGTRVTRAVLMETKNVWFRNNISASYEKFVEHIGCEASVYSQSDDFLTYAWYASDDNNAKLYINYTLRDDGSWKLYSLMSYSLEE